LQCVASSFIRQSLYPHFKSTCMLQCVAVCCSVLQCVAVCCSVWQCVAVYCSLIRMTICISTHQKHRYDAECCGLIATCRWAEICCSMLQRGAVRCSVLQCIAPSSTRQSVYRHIKSTGTLWCVAVCLQHVAGLKCVASCCSVVQCVAVCCSVLLSPSYGNLFIDTSKAQVRCGVLRCVACAAAYCSVLQCVAVCCSVLQHVAACCSLLRCVAVCCSVRLLAPYDNL